MTFDLMKITGNLKKPLCVVADARRFFPPKHSPSRVIVKGFWDLKGQKHFSTNSKQLQKLQKTLDRAYWTPHITPPSPYHPRSLELKQFIFVHEPIFAEAVYRTQRRKAEPISTKKQ